MSHILLALLLPMMPTKTTFHAVHISYGSLAITSDSISGEVTFFKDDWYKSIDSWYAKSVIAAQRPTREDMEIEYLKAHVRFWADNFRTALAITPRVSKNSDLSVTYEFHSAIPVNAHAIIVDSRAIISEFSDQMNLMTVKTREGQTSNVVLTADHSTSTIKL